MSKASGKEELYAKSSSSDSDDGGRQIKGYSKLDIDALRDGGRKGSVNLSRLDDSADGGSALRQTKYN